MPKRFQRRPQSSASAKILPGNDNEVPPDAVKGTVAAAQLEAKRNGQDVIFVKPGAKTVDDHPALVPLIIEEHVSYYEYLQFVEEQNQYKIFHLLIEYMPELACKAVDSFRRPLFRSTIVKGIRDFEQSWDVDREIAANGGSRMKTLLERMSTKPANMDNQISGPLTYLFSIPKRIFQNQTMFTKDEVDPGLDFVDDAVRHPKGILYEYRYDSEMHNGYSPTLDLILRVCNSL